MTEAALTNIGVAPTRPAGWQGIVADWSSDQRAFKNVSWGKAMMWIFLLSDTFIFSCFLLSYMTVSLRRKIHIMALPQETFLNARWSEDQSATMPGQPAGRVRASPAFVRADSVICFLSSLGQQLATDDGEIAHPRRQQSE